MNEEDISCLVKTRAQPRLTTLSGRVFSISLSLRPTIIFTRNYALPQPIVFLFSPSVAWAKSNPTPVAGAVYTDLHREN